LAKPAEQTFSECSELAASQHEQPYSRTLSSIGI
jgi:hypothetical protein